MNKLWYINQSGKNKGPFTSKEIVRFRDQELIKPFTLCWKKGMSEWKPLFEVEHELVALPTDLPPVPNLPDLPEVDEPTKVDTSVISTKLKELLPEVPVDEYEDDHEADSEEEYDQEFEQETESEEVDKKAPNELLNMMPDNVPMDKRVFPLFSSVAGAFFIVIFIGITGFMLSGNLKNELVFKNVSLDVLKSLQRTAKTDKFFVNVGLDKSGEVVFGRTNLAADALIDAKFSLIKDGNHKDEVSFQSASLARKGSIRFDDFVFEKGDKLVQGKYKIKVQAVVNDPLELIKNLVLNKPKKYIFEDTVYLIPGSEREYLENIEKLKVNKILSNKKLYSELDQKLQTVDGLITSIALHYRLSLGKSWGSYSAKEFEKRYARYAGPLLQTIILDDFEGLIKKSRNKLHVQQGTAKIHNLAKSVSAWSADLASLLKRYAKLNSRKRKNLRARMELERDKLKEEVSGIKDFISRD